MGFFHRLDQCVEVYASTEIGLGTILSVPVTEVFFLFVPGGFVAAEWDLIVRIVVFFCFWQCLLEWILEKVYILFLLVYVVLLLSYVFHLHNHNNLKFSCFLVFLSYRLALL